MEGRKEAKTEGRQGMQNIDADGYISIDYYTTAARDIVERSMMEKGQDPNKITTNELNHHLRAVYKALFKPERVMYSDPNCHMCSIEYNAENFRRLIKIYGAVAGAYDALPSFDALEIMTGLCESVIVRYLTDAAAIVRNIRKSYIQNRLNNTPIGVMTLANNDRDTGLLYTQQNVIASEVAKKSLSFADLQRIAEKTAD